MDPIIALTTASLAVPLSVLLVGGTAAPAGAGDRDLLNGAGGDDELDAGSGRDWCVGAGGEDLFRLCESVTDR